ncbi:PepSY-associated TM helix domain-containing protein [Parapedobacter koreensis]|uniref:PepSY-associated TM helix domain-containing protein n=1 Tax=Parapedobacter koreensis TaxID=332977 RepID=UPI0015A54027|nr:PepSY-associated TM helix domain-containing protein [Parapedobacter koreensis]
MSKLNGWLHLWLGLITGLVVFIVSITGCIYVFTDELKAAFYPDRLFVEPADQPVQPLSTMLANAKQALGSEYRISRFDIHLAANRTWIFRALETNPDGIGHWGYYRYYYRVYVNPYTAAVVHVEDARTEFFQLILDAHMRLLLGQKIGHPIVSYSVLIFVFMLISGLILWWPKKWTKKALLQSVKIKWRATFKRVNYDTHNVLGFYTLVPALVLAITGLVFSFPWVDHSLYFLFSGGQQKAERSIPQSATQLAATLLPLDRALSDVLQKHPSADMVSIRFNDNPTTPYDFQIRKEKSRTYHFEWSYYDRTNATLLYTYGTDDLNTAEKVRAMNFDLHVGSFMGMPGKILAFLASLVCASLPITGFLIWYNRKWGKKKKRRNLV